MNQSPVSSVEKRLHALAHYDILDSNPEPEFDDLTQLVNQICDTPISTITLLDRRRQWFKSRRGLVHSETPIEYAFCSHAIHRPDDLLVVPDAQRDARFRANPYVIGAPHVRFYAGIPLVTPEGISIGAVCAIDTKPRSLTPGQRVGLRALGRQAMALLELRRVRRDRRAAAEEASNRLEQLHAAHLLLGEECEKLRTSEAYFRHLTDHALDLITILDADGTIRFESRSIECEMGHPSEHYRGHSAFEFVHPEDRPGIVSAFTEALQREGNTPIIRFRFRHADGSYRMLEGSGKNLLNDSTVGGIVFNSRDVSERIRLQEEVDRARTERDDTVARLTGGVAHDFANILTVIQGLAELTASRLEGTPEAANLAEIQSNIGRAGTLTRQLLAISRRVVLQPRAVHLEPWLRSVAPRLAATLGRHIELTIAVHRDLSVWQDPDQLEQVLLQLAANARDSMPEGGRLSLDAVPMVLGPDERPPDEREGEVRFAELAITDQGAGMTPAILANLFQPFFTTKTDGGHPGLGLPMCRGIVEQGGGHLTVQSHLGCGTVVRLYLPASDSASVAPPVPRPAPLLSGVPTILFVDDEPKLRLLGKTILAGAGYRVLVAEHGKDALARLADLGDTPLDLLVTDVVMPGMNGVQLAAEVERLRPATRVLLCSGYTRDALVAHGGLPPGICFLAKPYTLAGLEKKVSDLLGAVAV